MSKINYPKYFNFATRGFTLIELLVFLTILSSLLLILSRLFTSIMEAQLESKSYSAVDADGRFILARLAYDFQSADTADSAANYILTPATGSADTVLKIYIDSVLYTYSASTSGHFQMLTPVLNNLTSSESSISGLIFQRLGAGENTDTIKVNFRLYGKTQQKSGEGYQDFQSAFSFP